MEDYKMGRVKDQLLTDEYEQYQKDLEPDYADYATMSDGEVLDLVFQITGTKTVTKMIDQVTEYESIVSAMKEAVEYAGKYCKNCAHCEVTKDPYSTGDSPCIRECTAPDPSDCPGLMR